MTISGWKNRSLAIASDSLLSYAVLYFVLLFYGAVYVYLYRNLLSDKFQAYQLYYNDSRWFEYLLTVIITPIAILPAGTVIRTASQFIFPLLVVTLFIPMNIILLATVATVTYWAIFSSCWIGVVILALGSRSIYGIRETECSAPLFENILILLCGICVIALILALRNGFVLPALSDIYLFRENLKTDLISSYTGEIYIHSLGGFLVAIAIRARRRLWGAIAMAGFILCYGVFHLKVALLAPLWLAYIFIANKHFVGVSTVRLYLTMMAPLLLGVVIFLVDPNTTNLVSLAFHYLVTLRLFAIPASMLSIYYEFFQTHPHTYWAHITGINIFVHNPYTQDLSEVMANSYGLGTLPGFFLAADGIEAAGIGAIPLVCIAMAMIFILINSAARRLDRVFLALCMAMPAHQLIDRPLATSLLTGGLLLLIVLLRLTPRISGSESARHIRSDGSAVFISPA